MLLIDEWLNSAHTFADSEPGYQSRQMPEQINGDILREDIVFQDYELPFCVEQNVEESLCGCGGVIVMRLQTILSFVFTVFSE